MLLSVEKREFLLDLVDVLNHYGTKKDEISLLGYTGNGVVYEDKLLKITSNRQYTNMVVTRKQNNIPIIMLENDVSICFHGEFIYLKEHISNLLFKIEGKNEDSK
jgi:hypothetical protein